MNNFKIHIIISHKTWGFHCFPSIFTPCPVIYCVVLLYFLNASLKIQCLLYSTILIYLPTQKILKVKRFV